MTYGHLRLLNGASAPAPAHLLPYVHGEDPNGQILFALPGRGTVAVPASELHALSGPNPHLPGPVAVVAGTSHRPAPACTVTATGPVTIAPSPHAPGLVCPACSATGRSALTDIPGAPHARCACGHTWTGPHVARASRAAADAATRELECPRCSGVHGLVLGWYPGAPWHTAWTTCPCSHVWHPLEASSVAVAYADSLASAGRGA